MIPAFAYPSTFAMVRAWAGANRISVAEARKRFAQYAILSAIAGSRFLGSALKGETPLTSSGNQTVARPISTFLST